MNIKAVVFDLYSTLIQAENVSWEPYLPLLKKTEMNERELRHHLLTKDYGSLEDLFKEFSVNDREALARLDADIAQVIRSARCYEDTIATLVELRRRGYKTGMISNVSSAYKQPFYGLHLDNCIDHWIFSCEVGLKKPNRLIFEMLASRLGVKKNEIVMVGDSFISDYQGAKKAGWKALLLDRRDQSGAEDKITSLKEIFDHI